MLDAKGPAGVKRLAAMVHASFPDLHFTIEDMVAEGDKVAYRYSVRGTHQGDFMGIAPTGKQFAVTGIHTYRVGDGKLQEDWVNWDTLRLLRQLGVLPEAAQGKKVISFRSVSGLGCDRQSRKHQGGFCSLFNGGACHARAGILVHSQNGCIGC